MPVTIRKKDHKYSVSTPGGVKAKGTSLRKAIAQKRLLHAIDRGWKPTGKESNLRKAVMRARAGKKKRA